MKRTVIKINDKTFPVLPNMEKMTVRAILELYLGKKTTEELQQYRLSSSLLRFYTMTFKTIYNHKTGEGDLDDDVELEEKRNFKVQH